MDCPPVSSRVDVLASHDDLSISAFEQCFAEQRELAMRARRVLPSCSVHDSQRISPFPVFFERAEGAYKWTGSSGRIVDYWMGHGSLLFGHAFPPIVRATSYQLGLGSHYGGLSPIVVRWAELITELVPSAEQVRFVSSGTEATLLAHRVARAYTGRQIIMRLSGHFHGWHDEALAYFVNPEQAGLNLGAVSQVVLAEPDDVGAITDYLSAEPVAGLILEPGGGSAGELPYDRSNLVALREATRRYGTLLIFDEIVSGFRDAPGGVQALAEVTPDLTVLGKILCGGLPGAALTGSRAVMAVFGDGTDLGEHSARVPHTGTFNANPVSAAAGATALEWAKSGSAQRVAREAASRIAREVNAVSRDSAVDVELFTHGSSIFHIRIGANRLSEADRDRTPMVLQQRHPEQYQALRRALLAHGVDCHPAHGWVSAAHDAETIALTVHAFEGACKMLRCQPGFAT